MSSVDEYLMSSVDEYLEAYKLTKAAAKVGDVPIATPPD